MYPVRNFTFTTIFAALALFPKPAPAADVLNESQAHSTAVTLQDWRPNPQSLATLTQTVEVNGYTLRIPADFVKHGDSWTGPFNPRANETPAVSLWVMPRTEKGWLEPPLASDSVQNHPDVVFIYQPLNTVQRGAIDGIRFLRFTSDPGARHEYTYAAYDGDTRISIATSCPARDNVLSRIMDSIPLTLRKTTAASRPAQPAPQISDVWHVRPDPGPLPLNWVGARPVISRFPSGEIITPNARSPYLAVRTAWRLGKSNGAESPDTDHIAVTDLRTASETGRILNPPTAIYTLSPDGALLSITFALQNRTATDIYSVKTGRRLPRIDLSDHPIGFGIHNRFVSVSTADSPRYRTHTWDTQTGQRLAEWATDTFGYLRHQSALSPGGRFLAVCDGKLKFLDLETGVEAGVLEIPEGASGVIPDSMSFSNDGTRLAALLHTETTRDMTTFRAVAWDMHTGLIVVNNRLELPPNAYPRGQWYDHCDDDTLQWVLNDTAWLVHGTCLVNPRNGRVVYTLHLPLTAYDHYGLARAVGDDRVFVCQRDPAPIFPGPGARRPWDMFKLERLPADLPQLKLLPQPSH